VKRALFLVVLAATAAAGAFLLLRRPAAHSVSLPRERLNIVLVTIDTLRADRVRSGPTPTIDALARAGASFTHARAAAPLTLPSHTTIFTGTYPPVHGVRENGVVFEDGPPTIARTLKDSGYGTAAFVGAYVLDRRFGLAGGFDVYDDRVRRDPDGSARLEAERPADEVVAAALSWLEGAAAPFFLWVHLYDPHAPYTPPAEFKNAGSAYDGEVAFADAQLGRLVAALERRRIRQSTLIAVAGDHGEGLGDHGEQTHGLLAYDSTLRVPLVLAGPGISFVTIGDPVSLVDLPYTLLHIAGVRPPDGMSRGLLVPQKPPERDVYAESEYGRRVGWHPVQALADGRWKFIQSSEAELYDLRDDPGETRNVASANRSVVDAMARRLRELSPSGGGAATRIDAEAAERLRALGYVGGGSASRTAAPGAPNPARVIASWNRFEQALSHMTRGRAKDALPALKTLTVEHPEAPVFHATYARALQETGNARAALAIYRDAVNRWPGDASLFHDLAVAARAAGDESEALRAEEAALALEPANPAALNGLGLLHVDAGRPVEAAAAFERAANADPSNASYWTNLGNARRELGDQSRAEAAYRRALQAAPTYPDALNGLGVVLVQQRRASDAVAWFERALQEAPDFHEARLNLGIAYQESGQRDKAADVYRHLLATAPLHFRRERQAAAALLKQL
jgi:arylsulfatase A-like enzyme/Flp pilus assembly protein TadD